MKPVFRSDGRWQVRIPRKLSEVGKRESKYFPTKSQADKFIKGFKGEHKEHGRAAVTVEERRWIGILKAGAGRLGPNTRNLGPLAQDWTRSKLIGATDAAEAFIKDRETAGLNPKTADDIRWRMRAFGKHFGAAPLHQVTPGAIEDFLKGFAIGWSRRSFYKRLKPFFAYSHRQRRSLENPMEELSAPDTPTSPRKIYTPEDFKKLVAHARWNDIEVCLFIMLSGLAFFRTRELVRKIANESTLEWRDILFDRDEIHVRQEVGKHTRRSSNERFVKMHPALKKVLQDESAGLYSWLKPGTKREGRIIDFFAQKFGVRVRKVFQAMGVQFIENGLRKSAISYWLAANPEDSIGTVARWAGNSEPSCRQHYLRILSKADGEKWFAAVTEQFA